MILTVTLNPTIDQTIFVEPLAVDGPTEAEPILFRQARDMTLMAGGKGNNVARVLHNFGHAVHALNLVGGVEGQTVLRLLEADGIPATAVEIQGRTRQHVTVAEAGSQRQIVYGAPSPTVTAAERQAVLEAYFALLEASSLVVLSGSVPDPCLADVYPHMIEAARRRGLQTIVDTSGPALAYALAARPDAAKPNLAEAERLLQRPLLTEADQMDALQQLAAPGVPLVILSLGERGVLALAEGVMYQCTPPPVPVVNPVGCGDCLVAGVAMGLVEGQGLEDQLSLGVAAGAANAAVWPAGGISPGQVAQLLPEVRVQRLGPRA